MRRPRVLPAFSEEEFSKAYLFLATRVAMMMGRKFEEGDWTSVYCRAKNIPSTIWSNLNIDINYNGLGIEQKMLRIPSDARLRDKCGTTLMHPSATRSIRIPNTDDANEAMSDILKQYADKLCDWREKVAQKSTGKEPDMRFGWLLWQENLREFLYFEQEMLVPDPNDYFAVWNEKETIGARKSSRNLWVFERETGKKRYSITTSAGAKIQPYFDVPEPTNLALYILKVQGEELPNGLIRVWVAPSTARELERLFGTLTVENLSGVVAEAAGEAGELSLVTADGDDPAIPLALTAEAYGLLTASFRGVSDEHLMQMLIKQKLSKNAN